MSKKKVSIFVIFIVSLGFTLYYFNQKSYYDRIDGEDKLRILTSLIDQNTTTFLDSANTNQASDAQKRRFKVKMGSCLLLALMKLPELQGDFEYSTLKEKIDIATKAIKVTHREQYIKNMIDCYRNLDSDLRAKIVIKL